jgi:hypothetical protein
MTFTTYAQSKFDLLNKHNIFIRQEQVEEAVTLPDSVKKRGKFYFVKRDGIGVVYQIENDTKKVVTFYPLKK